MRGSRIRRSVTLGRAGMHVLRGTAGPRDRAEVDAFVLERLLRRPIVFEDRDGLRYILHPGENARAYLEAGGNYEVAETAFCRRYVGPGSVALDVGANIGLYTLLLSQLVGPTGSVHAFEPEPRNVRRLRENIALNEADNVVVHPIVVFERSDTVVLNVFAKHLGSWHTLGRPVLVDPFSPGALAEPTSRLEVQAVSLDEHCDQHGIEHIRLLKVDVEGAELEVLRGARGLLQDGRIDIVLFEVSLPQIEALGHRPVEVFSELSESGYRASALDSDGRPGSHLADTDRHYGNYVAWRNPPAEVV